MVSKIIRIDNRMIRIFIRTVQLVMWNVLRNTRMVVRIVRMVER